MVKGITEKQRILHSWNFALLKPLGPALSNYLRLTENQIFGAFKIKLGDREALLKDCGEHVTRLIQVLSKRWMPSVNQLNLFILFDEDYLTEHKASIHWASYGRLALEVLRHSYKDWQDFNPMAVMYEWEALKVSLARSLHDYPVGQFWKQFLVQQQFSNTPGDEQYKHIFRLLDAYLISSPYEAECERGVSTCRCLTLSLSMSKDLLVLHVQSHSSYWYIEDLRYNHDDSYVAQRKSKKVRIIVRLPSSHSLLSFSSRFQTVIHRACASWNDEDYLHQIQLMTSRVPLGVKRSLSLTHVEATNSKPKKPKARTSACKSSIGVHFDAKNFLP